MKNIILIEDNVSDAELTIRSLERKGITILHLSDGEIALEYIFATGRYKERDINDLPKLILLDINMPRVDGIEVLKKIKEHELTKDIAVLLQTSSKEDFDRIEGSKHKANGFIVKPVDHVNFMKTVTTLDLSHLV